MKKTHQVPSEHAPSLLQRTYAFLGNNHFFYGIVILFIVETLWVVFTSHYPMAFDEDFHFGIITIYSHHLSPFLSSQPAGADMYGSVARDPSYLYQYLMSFPLRFVRLFTQDQIVQIICLRLINVVLFASCLPLYRRLLLRTKASKTLVHGCLFLFILIPIVPLLAAQINYDNLIMPLVPLSLLMTLRFNDQLIRQRRVNLRLLAQLAVTCLLTSLAKYAFLPIFAAIIGYVIVRLVQRRAYLSSKTSWHVGYAAQPKTTLLIVALLILSLGMFIQRDGLNVIRYHTPVPVCDQVLSVAQCSHYGPWLRDYNDANTKQATSDNPIGYTGQWLYGMWLRTLFAVDGPTTNFQTRGPLLLPAYAGIVFPALATVAFAVGARKLFRRYDAPTLWLFVATIGCYVTVLWLDEYRSFRHTGQPVAINGRYLLPVLALLFVLAAVSIKQLLRRYPRVLAGVSAAAVICMLLGGGVFTWIIRSNDSWYWQNQTVYDVSHAAQKLSPLFPGSAKPTDFLH